MEDLNIIKLGKKIQLRPNRINKEIFAKTVRLTDIHGKQIGIVNLEEALQKSEVEGLDLVEVNPNAIPPVCRIMNYGKFLYEKNKSIKEQKKKQKIIQTKEIKFRPGTDKSDYQVKLRNLIKFLNAGDKVKITLRFRGGELTHYQLGINMLNKIKNELDEFSTVETLPNKIEGRQIVMVLSPKKNNK